MGIILLPVLLITIAAWVLNLVFLLIRSNKGRLLSWKWSLAVALVLAGLIFVLYLTDWRHAQKVGVLEPLFSVPFVYSALPAAFGLAGGGVDRESKLLNIIGFGISFSGVLMGFLVIALQMTDPQHYFPAIEYTY